VVAGCCFSLTFDLQIQSDLPYRHLSRKLPHGSIATGITRSIDESGNWLIKMITGRRLQVHRSLVANEGL
jgi:outer membrane lipopolysaccharide assembly protein LptE/RlpB